MENRPPFTSLGPVAFPYRQLADDLKVRGLTPVTAAAKAELDRGGPEPWVRGQAQPRVKNLLKFLHANLIPVEPYEAYLAEVGPTVTLVCPRCEEERPVLRRRLKNLARRAKGRTAFSRRPDGRYECLCRNCSSQKVGAKIFSAINRERRIAAELLGCRPNEVDIERRTLEATQERFKVFIRQPYTVARREAHAEAVRLRGRIMGFNLCKLCGLIVHRTRWHKACWLWWLAWWRRHPGAPKEPPQPPGRPGDENLDRNFRAFFWGLKRTRSRMDLLQEDWWHLARYPGRHRGHRVSRSIVNAARDSFVRRLPGTWELVFSRGYEKTGRSKLKRQTEDRLRLFEKLFPLPEKLGLIVNADDRDSLIKRLHRFDVPEDYIVRLTGVDADHVRSLLLGLSTVEFSGRPRRYSSS